MCPSHPSIKTLEYLLLCPFSLEMNCTRAQVACGYCCKPPHPFPAVINAFPSACRDKVSVSFAVTGPSHVDLGKLVQNNVFCRAYGPDALRHGTRAAGSILRGSTPRYTFASSVDTRKLHASFESTVFPTSLPPAVRCRLLLRP